jgi:hypothetical protein
MIGVEFGLKTWKIITIAIEIIGLIFIFISFWGLKRETNKLVEMDDDEFIPEETTAKLIYYLNLRIVGIIVSAISGLIGIVMR